ncbi:membrane protein [Microbacterium phage FuzzBuster]|uniref:Membrane protein n=1 Tax=Microbacterium phage FuzzBuster TaxID=2590935 RepID=A0A516KUX8_9CAUD|nr:membrane protein [Microbacterium phage FuzzBuster]
MNLIQVAILAVALGFAAAGALQSRRGVRRARKGQAIADGWAHPSVQATNDPDTVIENNLRGHRLREEGRRMMVNGIRLSIVGFALAFAPLIWWLWA